MDTPTATTTKSDVRRPRRAVAGAAPFRKALSAVVVTASLVGCGGGLSVPADTVVPDAPSSTASEAGGEEVDLTTAGFEYLRIVRPTNCALMAYSDVESTYSLGNDTVDLAGLAELTGAMSAVARERDEAIRKMIGAEWPTVVSEDISSLALFWSALQRAELTVSSATDLGTWNSAITGYKSLVNSEEGGRSKVIRIKLGLPDFDPSECG